MSRKCGSKDFRPKKVVSKKRKIRMRKYIKEEEIKDEKGLL